MRTARRSETAVHIRVNGATRGSAALSTCGVAAATDDAGEEDGAYEDRRRRLEGEDDLRRRAR
jgi:hypothetical protein